MDRIINKSVKLTALAALIIIWVLIIVKKTLWAGGFLSGTCWSLVNLLLMINIFKIALLQKNKAKLLAVLLIKFPVLYLAGFLILISKTFVVSSLLLGALLPIIITAGASIIPNFACPPLAGEAKFAPKGLHDKIRRGFCRLCPEKFVEFHQD